MHQRQIITNFIASVLTLLVFFLPCSYSVAKCAEALCCTNHHDTSNTGLKTEVMSQITAYYTSSATNTAQISKLPCSKSLVTTSVTLEILLRISRLRFQRDLLPYYNVGEGYPHISYWEKPCRFVVTTVEPLSCRTPQIKETSDLRTKNFGPNRSTSIQNLCIASKNFGPKVFWYSGVPLNNL